MKKMIAAAVQMNSQPDLDYSMDQCYRLVKAASAKGAQLVGLPENFAFMGDDRGKHRLAEPIAKTVQETLPEWSRQFGIHVMAGGFPVRAASGKVYNRAMMFNPDGEIIAHYDKIHLFDVDLSSDERYRESDLVEAGKPEVSFCDVPSGDNPSGIKESEWSGNVTDSENDKPEIAGNKKETFRIGLSICYDIRFPELYRALASEGCDVLCVPAAFTQVTGEAHWQTLLRARAIENSAYVLAPAQAGMHGVSRKTHGHSMIIDPWGRVLADAGTEPGVITAAIEFSVLKEIREKLPALAHRVLP